ncbi:MAG: phosphoribosyltransferase family protein [Proteobacteria bacterium]|nr:phosphoribosyltransferase family protein [Pseudomonadota bacterium]
MPELRDVEVRPLFSAEQVEERIAALAEEIYRDYADAPLVLVSIAEGAVRFTEALVEQLAERAMRPTVQTVRARRSEGMELGAVQVEGFDISALDDCDVLVVDDIADEGRTLRAVLALIELAEPRSLKIAVLVDKCGTPREPLQLDYVGFQVERGWVVGFGMDLDGELRDLDEIGVVAGTDEL